MKKFALLATAMLSTVAFAQEMTTEDVTANIASSADNTGVVYLSGDIIQSTCKVATNSASKSVTLPTVETNDLKSVGATSNSVLFKLAVANCPTSKFSATGETQGVAIRFAANSANVTDDGTLTNTKQGANGQAAKNVEVQLLNGGVKEETVINLKTNDGNNQVHTLDGGAVKEFIYKARYVSKGQAQAGRFETSVPFEIEYK